MRSFSSHTAGILLCTTLILILFGVITAGILDYSFWQDEAFSAWLVRDEMRSPESLRETARFVRDSQVVALARVQDDVHPPLYYLLLDIWVLLTGDSEFALRLPSALATLLALAGTYAVGRQWFSVKTGMLAVLLLGTLGFTIYYAREARMYGLYLALATLATWSYSLWWHRPTIIRGLMYGIMLALGLYTHYTAFVMILAHLAHAVLTFPNWRQRAPVWQIIIPLLVCTIAFGAWLPVTFRQLSLHTGFAAPASLASDGAVIGAIAFQLTGNIPVVFLLSLVFSRSIRQFKDDIQGLLLLFIWILLPVILLFTINARGLSILQLRYLIPILPAWTLLIAYVLSDMRIPFIENRRVGMILTAIFCTLMIHAQFTSYASHWPPKPDWRGLVQDASTARSVQEPAIVYRDARSPLVYYGGQMGLFDGISIDLGWREFAPHETHAIANTLDNAEHVWGIGWMQAPESWDLMMALSENRGVRYRSAVQWGAIYQFDSTATDRLAFTFGVAEDQPIFAYRGDVYTRHQVATGDEICVPVVLEVLTASPAAYTMMLAMTRGYNEVVEAAEVSVESPDVGNLIEETFCLSKPDDDDFHLRLLIMNTRDERPLYVLESGLAWGTYLMRGTIEDPGDHRD